MKMADGQESKNGCATVKGYFVTDVHTSNEPETWLLTYFILSDGPAAYPVLVQNTKPLLTVSFTSGDISLMNNYDDLSPTIIRSGLKGTHKSCLPVCIFSASLML